jgi:hypothetical protein
MPIPSSEAFHLPKSPTRLSAKETIGYTKDLLEGLRRMATQQNHNRLAELLDAAAAEADRLMQQSAGAKLRK